MQPFNFTPIGKKPLQAPTPLGVSDVNALNAQESRKPMSLDEWMAQNSGDFDESMHPKTRRFLKGKHRGKTPEQVATKLAEQHARGLATTAGAIGHGAAGGLDTPTMAMNQADWRARFQSKSQATSPMGATAVPKNTQAGVGTVLKPPTGTGTVLQNPPAPAPFDFAASMMKPPTGGMPAAMPSAPAAPVAPAAPATAKPKSPTDPFYRTMTGKYGSGSATNISPVAGTVNVGGKQYPGGAFKPAVATPPVDPLAPALKKNFFA